MKLNELGVIIEDGREAVYKKGKAYKDIIALKGQISTCKDVINRDYSAIGRMFYEKFADDNPFPEFDKKLNEIKNATRAIVDLETQIEDIKGNM